MIRTLRVVTLLLLIVIPAASWGAALDDYYLSRLAPAAANAHALSGIIAVPVAPTADRTLTAVRHAAKRDWALLEPATQQVLAKVLARPSLLGEQTYPTTHFMIHYTTLSTSSAAVDPTDLNSNGVPDWVETVGSVMENVYNVEINQMGYNAPPITNRYDVYLEDLASQSAYGFTTSDVAVSSTRYTSYMEIDRAFTSSIFTHGGLYSPDLSLRITAAHEFHHAIQYGYNYYFPISFAEMTSTWIEDEVYSDDTQIYAYLADYLPKTGSVALNADYDGSTEYGRFIFNRYLAEKYGASVIRDVWTDLGNKPAPGNGADLPFLLGITDVLSAKGSDIGTELTGFAIKLAAGNWTTHTDQTSLIYQHALDIRGTAAVDGTVSVPKTTLSPYSFAYYKYTPTSGGSVTFKFTGKPAQVTAVALRKNADGTTTNFNYDSASGTIPVSDFPADSQIYLALVNTGSSTVTFPSSSSSGGGCFIATAAYGSYLHPKVAELRQFRDRYLMTNAPGRAFVAAYYAVSPPIAKVIAEHEWMRAVVRVLLTPLIFAVEHPYLALLFVLALAGGAGWQWGMRREKRERAAAAAA